MIRRICRNISEAFGLSHCDYPSMISTSAFLLRILSLNVDPRHKKDIPIFIRIWDILITVSYIYVYIISMFWFIFARCLESGDVVLALIVFSLGVSSEMGPCKLFFMFLYKSKLQEMVSLCLANNALAEPGSRLSSNLLKVLRIVKRRAVMFWSIIMGNGVIYILKALLTPGRHHLEDLFVLYGLEPMFESPNYEIAFTINVMAAFFCVYLPSTTVFFQIVSSGYIEAQMLAWSEELISLWDDANRHYSTYVHTPISKNHASIFPENRDAIVNQFVNQRLKIIIKAHATNIKLYKMMEQVFSGAIVLEFITLIVCLVAELLGGLENTYLEVPFALMQVGVDCFIGQKLIDAGVVFERAVYDCKWENFNKDDMKVVMTMMIISNRTMSLTAGSVTKLDFVSFLAIVKSIYSMYTTLRATMH